MPTKAGIMTTPATVSPSPQAQLQPTIPLTKPAKGAHISQDDEAGAVGGSCGGLSGGAHQAADQAGALHHAPRHHRRHACPCLRVSDSPTLKTLNIGFM